MPRLRYTGGSRYALRDGPTWETGDVHDVDGATAERLAELDKFELVEDDSDEDAADGDGDSGREYDAMTYDNVYNLAAEADIGGRSQMTKAELIDALEDDN